MTVEPSPLAPDDVPAAVALWEVCGLVRPWNDPAADARRALDGPASTLLGARDAAGALAGTVMVGDDGHRAWAWYLAVAPSARRRGLGRALMRAAERWAAARGAPKLELMVRAGNEAATAFHLAGGYRVEPVVVLSRWIDGRPEGAASPWPPGRRTEAP